MRLGVGCAPPSSRVATQGRIAVQAAKGGEESGVIAPGEAELEALRKAQLSKRERVLRIPSRRDREVRERGEQRQRKPLLEPPYELRGRRTPDGLGDRYAVPEPAMRKHVIVLTLVPRAVRKQPAREMCGNAGRAKNGLVREGCVVEQARRGEQRRRVPHLAIGASFIERRNEGGARLDEPFANARSETPAFTDAFEQRKGDADLQEPDGLEIGAEEHASRSQRIVAIGIAQIPLGERLEDAC